MSDLPVYDVVADYSADNTGQNDSQPAVQTAIDAAHNAGGGIVYLPIGVYKIIQALVIKSNIHIQGAGTVGGSGSYGATVLKPYHVGSHYPAFTIDQTANFWSVRKLMIDFSNCATHGKIAEIRQSPPGGRIKNIEDYGSGRIKVTSPSHGLGSSGTVPGITIENTTHYNTVAATVTLTDENSFYFTKAYVADETSGSWTAGGSGYSAGDLLTVSGGSNGQVSAKVVDSNGIVRLLAVEALGGGYVTTGVLSTTGGSGSHCRVYLSYSTAASDNPEDCGFQFPTPDSTYQHDGAFFEISDIFVRWAYAGYWDYQNGSWEGKISRFWADHCRYGFYKREGTTMVFENCFARGSRNHLIDHCGWHIFSGYNYVFNACACDQYKNGASGESDGYGANIYVYSLRGGTMNSFYFEGQEVYDNPNTFDNAVIFFNLCSGLMVNGVYSVSPADPPGGGAFADRNIVYAKTDVDHRAYNYLIKIAGSSIIFNGVSFGGLKIPERHHADVVVGGSPESKVYTIGIDEAERGGISKSQINFNGCCLVKLDNFANDANPYPGTRYVVGAKSAPGGNVVSAACWIGDDTSNDPSTYVYDYQQSQTGTGTMCWISGASGVQGT